MWCELRFGALVRGAVRSRNVGEKRQEITGAACRQTSVSEAHGKRAKARADDAREPWDGWLHGATKCARKGLIRERFRNAGWNPA
jgi:hypothetical protein